MEQHTQIAPVHVHRLADLFPRRLVQENHPQQFPVGLVEFRQDIVHQFLAFLGHQSSVQVDRAVGGLVLLGIDCPIPAARSIEFENDIVAHGIEESAQPLRMIDPTLLAKRLQDTKESFLADVLTILRGPTASAKLNAKEFAKIRREVLFDRRITLSQLPHVRRIKLLLFQVVTEGPLVYRWRAPGCNYTLHIDSLPGMPFDIPAWAIAKVGKQGVHTGLLS